MTENNKEVFTDWSQVPIVLKPKQLSKISRISSEVVYQLLKAEEGGIPCIKVGNGHRVHYLIYKDAFKKWLMQACEESRVLGV